MSPRGSRVYYQATLATRVSMDAARCEARAKRRGSILSSGLTGFRSPYWLSRNRSC
jgi:hypothetical protein